MMANLSEIAKVCNLLLKSSERRSPRRRGSGPLAVILAALLVLSPISPAFAQTPPPNPATATESQSAAESPSADTPTGTPGAAHTTNTGAANVHDHAHQNANSGFLGRLKVRLHQGA